VCAPREKPTVRHSTSAIDLDRERETTVYFKSAFILKECYRLLKSFEFLKFL
jgi:hypothetical protein